MTKIILKSYSEGWLDDYFLTNSGKRIDFHKYIADVYINGECSDYQIEISSFKKSVNVAILENIDLSEHGYDIDDIDIRTIILFRDKAYFNNFSSEKQVFKHLLKKAKKMLSDYLKN